MRPNSYAQQKLEQSEAKTMRALKILKDREMRLIELSIAMDPDSDSHRPLAGPQYTSTINFVIRLQRKGYVTKKRDGNGVYVSITEEGCKKLMEYESG